MSPIPAFPRNAGEGDAATCKLGDSMWQRLPPPRVGEDRGGGQRVPNPKCEHLTLSASIQKYAHLHEQMLRMEAQMILNKAGDKEVAVIVTRLDPQRQREIHLLRDRF